MKHKNMEKAVSILKNEKGPVAIFFDDDCDGVSSAAIAIAYFKSKKIPFKAFTGKLDAKTFAAFGRKKRFSLHMFLDYPVDQYKDFLKPFVGKKTVILDHHPVINDLNKMGFVYVNPRFSDPKIYYCTTHIAHDVFSAAGLKGNDWIKKTGMIGDREVKGSEIEELSTETVNAYVSTKPLTEHVKLAESMSYFKGFDDFVYNSKNVKIRESYLKELERQVLKFEKENLNEVVVFEIKSKYSLTPTLATRLFDMYPNKTIILYSKKPKGWSFSGRSRNFDMGKAFRQASKDIGKGGGHQVAAGAFVSDKKKFIQELRKILT